MNINRQTKNQTKLNLKIKKIYDLSTPRQCQKR